MYTSEVIQVGSSGHTPFLSAENNTLMVLQIELLLILLHLRSLQLVLLLEWMHF
jgi:hypothetical protein